MEHTIRIGGEAGQGLQLIGGLLAKFLSRRGYEVFTHQDYMSRIRGGHNFYQIRFADRPISASRDRIDILVALDLNTINIHRDSLAPGGIVLHDPALTPQPLSGHEFLPIPFSGIVERLGFDPIMANAAAVGAVLGLLGLEVEPLAGIFGDFIHKQTPGIIETNLTVARAGFEEVRATYPDRLFTSPPENPERKLMLLNGSQAIGLGALVGGCRFFAAYPMTPATGIMNYLAGMAGRHGLIIEQAEDEIAAVNMAIGASFGGVRAMTASSGGGFALMTEGLSLAAMTETPLVIAEAQRPGPATGFPTRTEQGDLNFVLYGGHGEFPRVVFTPGTPEQAFHLTAKAFHLAEKYQITVIVQSDQYLADCEWTSPGFSEEGTQYQDFRLRGEALQALGSYQRYAETASGISPLAVPGASRHLVVADSDEHDQEGHIVEDAETRITMTRKRYFRKLELLRQEIDPPILEGHAAPKLLLIGYGSTYGVLKEAVAALAGEHAVALLHFSEVWPFPPPDRFDYSKIMRGAERCICVENNATGQFARLLRAEIGFDCLCRINRYDGRPFTIEGLLGEINAYLG